MKEMIALKYGQGKNISSLELAQKYETYARINKLPKKDRYATLHKMTLDDPSTPNEVKALSNYIADLQSPLAPGGSKKVLAQAYEGTAGAGYYVQYTNNLTTTSGAPNYHCLGPNAPDPKFNANMSGIQKMLQACMNNANLANNMGERCEIGLAMILALINPGNEYIAFTGSEAGADVMKVGGNIIYELKYSQSPGKINTMFSASPPTVSKTNKYYVFLTDQRSYIVSSPLLARLSAMSSEVPDSFSDADIQAYEEDLLYYVNEVPEFFDELYEATKASEFNDDVPELIPLMNKVIEKINSNEIAIATCVKLIGINDLPVTAKGQVVGDKANILKSPEPTTEEYETALREAREDFIGPDGKIKSYDAMRSGQKNRFRKLIVGMLQVSGAEQRKDSITMPTPRIGIGGKGTPVYSMRKTSGVSPGGSGFSGTLKRADLSNNIKMAMIAGKTNDPNYPINVSANVLNNFINGVYKTNITDANGNPVPQRFVKGPQKGQIKIDANGNPKLVEVPLIDVIRRDEKTLDELLKELLRNPAIFNSLLGEFKTSLIEDDIFGMAEDLVTNADDGYFEMWARDEPEVKNSNLDITEIINSASVNFQSSQIAAAFILYTNYPRNPNNPSHDLQLFNALYLNNSVYGSPVAKAMKFADDAAKSLAPDRALLSTLLKRYAAMERKAYKFNESKRIYKKILQEILK